jgi:NAD(P)-dependent dehydrogenase (short-subunit alcohol dehydrogenase family)
MKAQHKENSIGNIMTNTRKTALVTGMSRGIGKAICEKLVKEGYFVYGTYNTGEKEAKIIKEALKSVEIFQADFRERKQTLAVINKLSKIQFDAVVNDAGMFEGEIFDNFDFKIWDDILAVNLTTPLLFSVMLQKNIKENGSIVNIASTDGFQGSFASMSYSASKAALMNVTKTLANNLGKRNIRVNAIAPGWINTKMATESSYQAAKITPLGRNGKPEEVADLVYYLISGSSSFITGATIVIDGGYTCVDTIMKMEAEEFKKN